MWAILTHTAGLATIDDEITIIVPTDLTDEDAVRVDYLDTDGEGIATQIGDQVDAPTHSGIVSFDGSNYKVADTVTVTLTDADLNTDSDTTEVYTLANDTTYGDRIGEAGTGVAQSGRLLDITFDDATWTYMGCGVLMMMVYPTLDLPSQKQLPHLAYSLVHSKYLQTIVHLMKQFQPPLVKTWKSTMLTIQTPLVN